MAEHYSTHVEVREITTRRLDHVTCDWCGGTIPPERMYERTEFRFAYATGDHFPEDDWHPRGWQVSDLCAACVERLRLLLIENGLTLSSYDPLG